MLTRRQDGRLTGASAAFLLWATFVTAATGCSVAATGPDHGAAETTDREPSAAVPFRTLLSPACSSAASRGPLLPLVRTAMVKVPGSPLGVVVTPDRRWAFVSLESSVEVVRLGRSLAPATVRNIPVPGQAAGEALTRDGRYLLAASGSGAVVISTARAERGTAGAVLGTLADPRGGIGAIEVALSPPMTGSRSSPRSTATGRPSSTCDGRSPAGSAPPTTWAAFRSGWPRSAWPSPPTATGCTRPANWPRAEAETPAR